MYSTKRREQIELYRSEKRKNEKEKSEREEKGECNRYRARKDENDSERDIE